MVWREEVAAEAGAEGSSQPIAGHFETLGWLDDGKADVVRRLFAVELARTHDHARSLGKLAGERPRITPGGANPEVETAAGHVGVDAEGGEQFDTDLEPTSIRGPQLVNMSLIAPRGDRGGLHWSGDHAPRVFANLSEVVDEISITSVEAGPSAGQIRTLRQGVDGDHALSSR